MWYWEVDSVTKVGAEEVNKGVFIPYTNIIPCTHQILLARLRLTGRCTDRQADRLAKQNASDHTTKYQFSILS